MKHKVWFASDLHLGHKLLSYPNHKDGTPREGGPLRQPGYEEKFLKAWHDIVGKDDVICLLGDMAFSNVAYWFARMQELPGKKFLLLGNHDKNRLSWYEKWGFEEVVPFGTSQFIRYDLGNILLTHVPAFESVLTTYDDRFKGLAKKHEKEFDGSSCILNIHGHTHGLAKENHKTFDVSLECIDYAPIELEQVIERKFK